ncbi:hypothetical protein MANES_02G009950v8 [Manihot esculenta]|uniref:Uncharacterized protein n=1 Tax=Manihot esculenta TaxID=3983 RepID=A0ACB7I4T4_MANES|nr:hypothetical protein MANES_02G009950v8 [Manihot esculenta]
MAQSRRAEKPSTCACEVEEKHPNNIESWYIEKGGLGCCTVNLHKTSVSDRFSRLSFEKGGGFRDLSPYSCKHYLSSFGEVILALTAEFLGAIMEVYHFSFLKRRDPYFFFNFSAIYILFLSGHNLFFIFF